MQYEGGFKKAYDSVRWGFIEKLSVTYGFPGQVVQRVMTCITMSKFLLNSMVNCMGTLIAREA